MTTPKPKKQTTSPFEEDELINRVFSALTVGKMNPQRTLYVEYDRDKIKIKDMHSGRKFVIIIKEVDPLV